MSKIIQYKDNHSIYIETGAVSKRMSSDDEDENMLPRRESALTADEDEEDDVIARELPRAMQRLQLNRSRFLTRLRPRRANRRMAQQSGRVRSVAFKGVRLEREQPSSTVRMWRKARSGATSPEVPHAARVRAQREASVSLSAQRCIDTRLRARHLLPPPQQRVRRRAASL